PGSLQRKAGVISRPPVDLPEGLDARAVALESADPIEERCLAVIEYESAAGKGGARHLIPTEYPPDGADIEGQIAARAEPVDLGLEAHGPHLLREPTAQRRVGERVGRCPSARTVLQRDRCIEPACLDAQPQVIARIGPELQIRLRQSHGVPVGMIPRGGIQVQLPDLAERYIQSQAQASELQS